MDTVLVNLHCELLSKMSFLIVNIDSKVEVMNFLLLLCVCLFREGIHSKKKKKKADLSKKREKHKLILYLNSNVVTSTIAAARDLWES